MGTEDIKNAAQQAKGKVQSKVGDVTGNDAQEAQGQAEQAEARAQQERLEEQRRQDAARKVEGQ